MRPSSKFEQLSVSSLKPWDRNARTHSKKQVQQIAKSIERFGFTNPVLIDDDNAILAGHGRVQAAKLLKLDTVPCVRLSQMSAAEKRAYIIADNKLALNAGWDEHILAEELKFLVAEEAIDIDLTGFSIAEIDGLIDGLVPEEKGDPKADQLSGRRNMNINLLGALLLGGAATSSSASYAQTLPAPTIAEIVSQFCSKNAKACEDGDRLARRMKACLSLPGAPNDFTMVATVVVKDGASQFSNIGLGADAEPWQKEIATAVSDAITDCEPYAGLSGTVVFLVTPALLQPDPK